jgi:hypothetical protein
VRRLLNWRSALAYTHRWLGIAGCLLFFAWFVSGVVLMYARMPSLSAEERLARLATLDLSRARIEPADAQANVPFEAASVRLSMLGARPVYRFAAGPSWSTVYADTGELLPELTADEAADVARAFVPEHASTLRHDAHLLDSDQWTLSSALRPLMPLHRFTLGDEAGTTLYISAQTGDPVLTSTRRERMWGYLGAVVHWLYFTPLRRNSQLWVDVVVWLSIVGCLMCLSGLLWGLWRYSPYSRYRLKRVPARSPYAGFMKWHHYAGLIFGLATCTWIFSGLMSMTPWDWSPGNSPTRRQREAVTGGPIDMQLVTLERIRRSVDALSSVFAPKELEVAQFRGEPFVVAYRPPEAGRAVAWLNTDVAAFVEPSTLERRLVWLAAPERGTFTRFAPEALMAVAERAMPEASLLDAAWLDEYDAYYYDRSGSRSLPVLRARYSDEAATWLYFDPFKGAVVQKEVRRSRLERWLYHGLHSLDFPFLYDKRPLWDLVVIVLSVGGAVLSVTTMVPAWRRLRRHARKWAHAVGARGRARTGLAAKPQRHEELPIGTGPKG